MQLIKSSTGIHGLDEITGGGLPQGRATLVCGGSGCGKTVLGMQFLLHGALQYGEPGVFMAFEETADDLTQNLASIGFDLADLTRRGLLAIDFVRIERGALEESGAYDLEGLFVRLGFSVDRIGAKRVVLDTVESLFSVLPTQTILRAEMRRLFLWLKEKKLTTILTGERGSAPGALTRHGFEEYVSDCVILLDNRVTDMISSRRLRIIKYRGSTHGLNEYPFLIDAGGFSVLPITSLGLQHEVSLERVSTGVAGLDAMLGGAGYFRGSSVLVSGTAGTGKSSLAAHFAAGVCARGERILYFAFEESAGQIVRNMRSIGIDLGHWVERDLLRFHASRPTLTGLEMHLITMLNEIDRFNPHAVIVDPLNSFVTDGNEGDVKLMLLRLADNLKQKQLTALFTCLTEGGAPLEKTDVAISSLIDTWLLMRDIESGNERKRGVCILKSRGMSHSNQVREFKLTERGVQICDGSVCDAGARTAAVQPAEQPQAHGVDDTPYAQRPGVS